MTHTATKPSARIKKAFAALRAIALAYPGAKEDFPWGHSAFKVGKKAFIFAGADADGMGLSIKLKASRVDALELPFTKPTEYGLGKHGWVSASFEPGDAIPMGLLELWIDESYRLIAPKKLVKALDADNGAAKAESARASRARTAPRKKAATSARAKPGRKKARAT
jgi:predicted DNA-binding protein (MmcQ/YjbR family)